VPRGATRREGARLLAEQLPVAATPATATLAHRADATVFGAAEPTPDEVDRFWAEVDELVGTMRGAVPWRRRVSSRVSLRSVRGADAPPLHVAAFRAVTGGLARAGRRAAVPVLGLRDRIARGARRRARARRREGR
jgi:hypothetical protein